MSARMTGTPSPIPGGETHIVNHPTVRQRVPVGDSPAEYGAMEAHGVPPSDATFHDRAEAERGPNSHAPVRVATAAKPVKRPDPVPVYIVTEGAAADTILTASPRHITVPNNQADPVRVCGRNFRRNRIGLLNEDTATNIRFAQRPSDLTNGGGALLPWPTNSYMWFETQDELYAVTVSTTLAVTLSIVEEFDTEM